MAKKRYSRQQIKKLFEKRCFFCHEDNYDLLDAHRIIPGEQGGKYNDYNILVLCSNCHRKTHAGTLKILGKHTSTHARGYSIRYMEDGQEKWK